MSNSLIAQKLTTLIHHKVSAWFTPTGNKKSRDRVVPTIASQIFSLKRPWTKSSANCRLQTSNRRVGSSGQDFPNRATARIRTAAATSMEVGPRQWISWWLVARQPVSTTVWVWPNRVCRKTQLLIQRSCCLVACPMRPSLKTLSKKSWACQNEFNE